MDIKTKPTKKTIHVDRLMRTKKLVINKGINKGINNLSAYKVVESWISTRLCTFSFFCSSKFEPLNFMG